MESLVAFFAALIALGWWGLWVCQRGARKRRRYYLAQRLRGSVRPIPSGRAAGLDLTLQEQSRRFSAGLAWAALYRSGAGRESREPREVYHV